MKSKTQDRPGFGGRAVGKRTRSSFDSSKHYSSIGSRTPVYAGAKPIGYVEGKTFYKSIKGSKHILHTPPAIAFDNESLCEAELLGARFVQVNDTEKEIVYRTSIDQIWSRGFGLNRGHGQQQALPLSEWNRGPNPVSRQLSIFEVPQ